MIGGLGLPELIVVLGIGVLVFGASRIPDIAKSLGKAIKEFKKAGKEITDNVRVEPLEPPKQKIEDKRTPKT